MHKVLCCYTASFFLISFGFLYELKFHDADIDTDILTRIVARMSVSVPVSAIRRNKKTHATQKS